MVKRVHVVKEYKDHIERHKVFGRIQLEHDGDLEHEDELVYETHREYDQHFHRVRNSWAVSMDVFQELIAMEVDKIRVVSRPTAGAEEDRTYEVSMPTAVKYGVTFQYPDCDLQVFIPVTRFYDPRKVYF